MAHPIPPTITRLNEGDPEALIGTEWLLTNGLGGFAMGTALGTPTRRYHALLVASMSPPVQRIMALSSIAESVIVAPGCVGGGGGRGEERFDLAAFRFRPGVLHPRGDAYLQRFEKDLDARWHYLAGGVGVTKTVHLFQQANMVSVRYDVGACDAPVRLILRPLAGLRDFHALNLRELSRERLRLESGPGGRISINGPAARLHIWCESAAEVAFAPEPLWWYDFQYDQERERGYDFLEDLFHPGAYTVEFPAGRGPSSVTLFATTDAPGGGPERRDAGADRKREQARLGAMLEHVLRTSGADDQPPHLATLVAAADDFVVRRTAPVKAGDAPGAAPQSRTTIIAGYPWFADWGRDSMIALPGLLLATGRHAEARSVLLTFAGATANGLVPNVFDDYTGQPHYNTVDASLWFIHAACRYVVETLDQATFVRDLLPACRDIIAAYIAGTRYGIRMDDQDGLISAGDAGTQLTWMDAKRDGVTFTPRHGKAVEINALWYNALKSLVRHDPDNAARHAALAERVARSFAARFWNPQAGCLFDTLAPGPNGADSPQGEVRPNQVFAVSLPHSPLDRPQQRAVTETVLRRLLTPCGVRTLDPGDWRYKGRYRGRMFERDAAYHNGTAWPWLLGPLAEAVLRVDGFSSQSRARARAILAPLYAHLDTDCLGQLPEVFDGDHTSGDPQRAGGCPAQAWSVAEALRISVMIARADAGAAPDSL